MGALMPTYPEIFEEDVQSIVSNAFTVVETGLAKYGLKMSIEEENELYDKILLLVELKAGCPDFRHHL